MVEPGYTQLTQIVTHQEASAEEQEEYDREKVGDVRRYGHSIFEAVHWHHWHMFNQSNDKRIDHGVFKNPICSYQKCIIGSYKKLVQHD